jgi:hypothetical protein
MIFPPLDIFTESFDPEEQVIIGLDSLCSRHLFSDKSDFISDLTPVEPFEIHGVGGNMQAVSKGNVRLRFRDSDGKIHDKVLQNAYYAPESPVRLISIPQLVRDTDDRSSLSTGGFRSVFVWDGDSTTVSHTTHSGVPFLQAYVGNPTHHSLYNICNLAHNCVAINQSTALRTLTATTGQDPYSTASATEENIDINDDLDDTTHHIRSLMRAPLQSDKQRDYTL